jgi:hypothetical protein
MIKKNTYTLAYEACELYFSETGLMPTIEAIKSNICINSPTTISTAIKDWKQALSQSLKSNQTNPALPKSLMDAMLNIWELSLSEVRNALHDKAIELQEKQSELESRENALNDETKHVQQILILTEQNYQEKINQLKSEIDRLIGESISIAAQTEHLRFSAIEFEKSNAVLTEQIRQEQDKYCRLEVLYEKEHEWAIKRIEEEKNSYKEQVQYEMQRMQSEIARNKQANELLQAKFNLTASQADEYRNKITELERNITEEKLKVAGLALNEAKIQNILSAKEVQIKTLLNKSRKKAS